MENNNIETVTQLRQLLLNYSKKKINQEYLISQAKQITINCQTLSDDEYYDCICYFKILNSILNDSKSPESVSYELLSWDKCKQLDKVLGRMEQYGLHQEHDAKPISINQGTMIVYIDQNILSVLIRNNEHLLLHDCQVVYSPSHIEEIALSDTSYHEQFLKYISDMTKDTEILFETTGVPIVVHESPYFVYENRVLPELDNINSVKNIKAIDCSIDLLSNLSNTQKYNGNNLINDPLQFCLKFKDDFNVALKSIGADISMDSLLANTYHLTNYKQINNIIHDLYHAMDKLGFKRERISVSKINKADDYDNKCYQKIKSSRLDIEHLLYASACNIFFTMDERLFYRAKIIYFLLRNNCKVYLISEDSIKKSIADILILEQHKN